MEERERLLRRLDLGLGPRVMSIGPVCGAASDISFRLMAGFPEEGFGVLELKYPSIFKCRYDSSGGGDEYEEREVGSDLEVENSAVGIFN